MTPHGWPDNVNYITRNIYSKGLSADDLATLGVKKGQQTIAQKPCPLVKIKKVVDPNHPAYGQNGLFAAAKLKPNSHIVDYLGYVHTQQESDESSDYDILLDRFRGIGIDAQKFGTEARMVNDYRGIGDKPNVMFENRTMPDGEVRMAIFVGNKPISKGQELLINYGKGFWNARTQADGHT